MSSRADERLVELGLVPSRARAQAEIRAGTVTANGKRVAKPSERLAPSAILQIAEPENPWVSRGGLKLAHGLEHFGIDALGAVALDIGASTGGFTQVLLAKGARRVYAVDVGHSQLHATLRADECVVVLESRDARALDRAIVPDAVDILVADVSFISLKLVLPVAMALAAESAKMVVLVKPQFELGPGATTKGIVREEAARHSAVQSVADWIQAQRWTVMGWTKSPIRGGDGNEEFLLAAQRT